MNPLEKLDKAIDILGRVGSHTLSIRSDAKAASEALTLIVEAVTEIRKNLNTPAPPSPG